MEPLCEFTSLLLLSTQSFSTHKVSIGCLFWFRFRNTSLLSSVSSLTADLQLHFKTYSGNEDFPFVFSPQKVNFYAFLKWRSLFYDMVVFFNRSLFGIFKISCHFWSLMLNVFESCRLKTKRDRMLFGFFLLTTGFFLESRLCSAGKTVSQLWKLKLTHYISLYTRGFFREC